MYQSRLHATNGVVSVAIDALSGELLEFVREDSGDNALKNDVQSTWSLLDGLLLGENRCLRFHIPRYLDIRADSSLKPSVSVMQQQGSAEVLMRYPYLITEEGRADIGAEIRIVLPKDDCRTLWYLKLMNRTGLEMDDVAFPAVDGIWLGENWQDDILVYPHFAGAKINNPTEQLASAPRLIHWKWQEYIYSFNVGQATGVLDDRGAYVHRLNYSGPASMVWMDLYDPAENAGIYIACRNANLSMKSLRMESFGAEDPGAGVAILHRPGVRNGTWESDECVLAFHPGDWHWGADDYREWFATLPMRAPHKRPDWFLKSPGLMAHYDFQYQSGGIVHTFKDIPGLMKTAMETGINHLLLSGWNTDGFDYGFPHYTPNPRLGSEQDLKDALAECRRMGGHVCFYINSRLCNTVFEDQAERIRESAIMNRDGSLFIEKYGADDLAFASLCINDTSWRAALKETVRYLTHDIGADGMYLDQLAMGTSCKCYHPGHTEHAGQPCAWNGGYSKLLREMEEDYDSEGMALIYEGCNDAFGPYSCGQLVSEMFCPFQGRMPEVYKYTFPDQILVDMMNPRRNSAMRPEHIARHSTELLHNAFTMGAYFWCYDLEWDNTWRRDPEQLFRLKKMVALRRAWLEHYGQGTFRDTIGLRGIPAGTLVKRFDLDDGVLLACAKEGGLSGNVRAVWEGDRLPSASVWTADDPSPADIPCRFTEEGLVEVALPDCEEAFIVLHR